MEFYLHNFAETDIDTDVKQPEGNQGELTIGDAKDALIDEEKGINFKGENYNFTLSFHAISD